MRSTPQTSHLIHPQTGLCAQCCKFAASSPSPIFSLCQMREIYSLLADTSPTIREAAAILAAKMLRAEADSRGKVMMICFGAAFPWCED